MNEDSRKKITVEDLLRLKKAERPPEDFWVKFDAEIRAKQLSAIVSKRPWWAGLTRSFTIVRSLQLPLGAAAAVALTYAGVRYVGIHPEPAHAVQGTYASAAPLAQAVVSTAPALAAKAPAETRELVTEVSVRHESLSPKAIVAATTSHIVQAPTFVSTEAATASPFADGIAVTLADYRSSVPDIAKASSFGNDREFEPSVAPARQAVSDPLAHMDPAEERRSRLLAPALAAGPRALASDWMKERASNNDRMYESMDEPSSNDRSLVGFRF
ncbi:MAG TPA: hypothetical protein VFE25_16660 [Opitutaceae bacterium]|jgi:hypothetical protein|nr:hypothetical protein [Opitutaceae bacterium]